jgi:hypothetical protein
MAKRLLYNLFKWPVALIAILLGDAYAAHLILNPKPEPLNPKDIALAVEFELAKKH